MEEQATLSPNEIQRIEELKKLLSSGDPLEKYKKYEMVGKGGNGSVYRGKKIDGGRKVAIKVIPISEPNPLLIDADLTNEIAAMKYFPHPNIPEYLDSYIVDKTLWIVMEFIQGVRLDRLINKIFFSPFQIASICNQILEALRHMHANKVIHRDIKSSNIMVGRDGVVRVIDFGGADFDDGGEAGPFGTRLWMAPEMIRGDKYNTAVDMWSFGITVFEMVTGNAPYSGEPKEVVLDLILENGTPKIPLEEKLDRGARAILKHCLQVDPEKRITAEQMLQHQFLKNMAEDSEDEVKALVEGYYVKTQ